MSARKVDPAAVERLRAVLNPGDTLYTILRHVSRSGMRRAVDVILATDSVPHSIAYNVGRATASSFDDKHGGIIVNGCGMDVGFELVYNLGRVLWPDGFTCIGENCHSNDHSNGDRDYTPHHHQNGGYALRQRWL